MLNLTLKKNEKAGYMAAEMREKSAFLKDSLLKISLAIKMWEGKPCLRFVSKTDIFDVSVSRQMEA